MNVTLDPPRTHAYCRYKSSENTLLVYGGVDHDGVLVNTVARIRLGENGEAGGGAVDHIPGPQGMFDDPVVIDAETRSIVLASGADNDSGFWTLDTMCNEDAPAWIFTQQFEVVQCVNVDLSFIPLMDIVSLICMGAITLLLLVFVWFVLLSCRD